MKPPEVETMSYKKMQAVDLDYCLILIVIYRQLQLIHVLVIVFSILIKSFW